MQRYTDLGRWKYVTPKCHGDDLQGTAAGTHGLLCIGRKPAMLAPVLALGFEGTIVSEENSEQVRWCKALAEQLNIRTISEGDGSSSL